MAEISRTQTNFKNSLRPAFRSILPTLGDKVWVDVNLDSESKLFAAEKRIDPYDAAGNKLLLSAVAEELVDWSAKKHKSDLTYGGYLEDRGFFFAGSYLEAEKRFIHRGIDYNAPAGTPISSPIKATVHTVDDDLDQDGGWGPRVILVSDDQRVPDNAVIFGHLKNVAVRPGDIVIPGTILAEIGAPPTNGNWFAHLHVQQVDGALFRRIVESGKICEIDGYGLRTERELTKSEYPDPSLLLEL